MPYDLSQLDPKKRRKLEKLMKLIDQGDGAILEHLLEIEEKFEETISEFKSEVESLRKEVAPNIKDILDQVKGKDGEDAYVPKKGVDYFDGKDGNNYIITERDKKDIAKLITVPVVEKIIEKVEKVREIPMVIKEITEQKIQIESPITGEQIVDKINDLPIDDPKLLIGKEHIRGLSEELKEIRTTRNAPTPGGIMGRDLIKDIDISSQLDGVVKTFNIPAVYNIVNVNLSSFPYGSLRKGVDFTYTNTSITFTSEIDAATQLSAGQACVLTVVSG